MDWTKVREISNMKLSLFSAIYCLAIHTPKSPMAFNFETLLYFLLEISFPFSVALPDSSLFPLPIAKMIRQLWTYNAGALVQQGTAYAISAFIVANFVYVAYLTHFYSVRRGSQTPPQTLMKLLQTHIHYSCGPLIVPYVGIMLNYITCNNPSADCTLFSTSFGETFYFLIVSIIHCLFAMCYDVSVYDWSPLSQMPGIKAHHRVTVLTCLFRSISAVIFGLFDSNLSSQVQFSLIIYCMLYQASVIIMYWYQYPYYKRNLNYLYTAIYAIALMASLSMFLGLISKGAGDFVCIGLFLVGSFLLLPTLYSLIHWRLSVIESTKVEQLKRESEIEIKIRQLMEKLTSSHEFESDTYDAETCNEIETILTTHIHNFEDSFKIIQIWATYLFICKKNKFSAMNKLRFLLNNSPFVFDILPIQIRLRYISAYVNSDDLEEGLSTYEEQVRLERVALESMSKCLSAQLKFWGTLVSEDYNMTKLEKFTSEISQMSETARSCLQRIVFLSPKSPYYRRLYSHFLLNIANDEAGAKRQLSRAMELESDDDGGNALTDPSNCIFVISGEAASMGTILEVNKKTCEVFGFTSEDIIGRNITVIMARPFVAPHDSLMINYIENKPHNLNTITKALIIKGSNGHCFEGQLQIREFTAFAIEPSIAFFGTIKVSKDRMFCVVDKKNMAITDVSGQFLHYFKIDLQKLKDYEISVFDVMPNLQGFMDRVQQTLLNNAEYRFALPYSMMEHTIELMVVMINIPYIPPDYYVIVIESDDDTRKGGFMDIQQQDTSTYKKENKFADHFGNLNEIFKVSNKKVLISNTLDDESDDDSHSSNSGSDIRGVGGEEVASQSSKSSKSSNLLRMGLNRTNQSVAPSIKYLYVAIMLLLFLLCAMGITVQLLWSGLTIDRYQSTLNLITIPIRRATTVGSYSAQIFEFLIRGDFYTTEQDAVREEARIRQALPVYRSNLGELKDVLYQATKSLTTQEIQSVSGVHFDLIDYHGTPRMVSFEDAIDLYRVTFTVMLNKSLSELKVDPRTLNFLIANLESPIPTYWENAISIVLAQQQESGARIQLIEFGFMIAALSLSVFALFFVFFPILYYILKQKHAVYRMFETMEMGNLKEVISQCIEKLGDLDGVDQMVNNMEIQDILEVIASKSKSSKMVEKASSKTSNLRIHVSNMFVNNHIILLSFSILITTAYFAGFYVWWANERTIMFNDIAARVYVSCCRNWYCDKLVQSVVMWNDTLQSININVTETESWENQLWQANHALYYGDPQLGINSDIRVLPGGDAFLEGNLCTQFYNAGEKLNNNTPCETYYDNVLTRGSHELYIALISLSENLRKTYVNEGINKTLPIIRTLKDMTDNWIPHVANIFDSWLQQVFINGFQMASQTRSIGTAAYVIICVLLCAFVYLPMVIRLNKEIQQTRNMLTIIPGEIVESSATLREKIRDVALRIIQL